MLFRSKQADPERRAGDDKTKRTVRLIHPSTTSYNKNSILHRHRRFFIGPFITIWIARFRCVKHERACERARAWNESKVMDYYRAFYFFLYIHSILHRSICKFSCPRREKRTSASPLRVTTLPVRPSFYTSDTHAHVGKHIHTRVHGHLHTLTI